ncbi:hypothetical protein [Comamonas serinivorans]|uniref:hypothetical protein n=1 Tax=Comamonas serinivorans TaxID=1082851 RepID=UPI0012FA1789|nr:hypothetical protein [Comamonas serinivorans]
MLPHPSWRNSGWLKRNPWFEAELLPVLRRAVAAELAEPVIEPAPVLPAAAPTDTQRL